MDEFVIFIGVNLLGRKRKEKNRLRERFFHNKVTQLSQHWYL
jgi:hypothetical protein